MNFKIYSELSYEVIEPTTFIFNIQAANSPTQKITEESLEIIPFYPYESFVLNDTRFIKMLIPAPANFTIKYKAMASVSVKTIDITSIKDMPLIDCNAEVLSHLFPSRHCQSDKLEKLAVNEFGKYQGDFAKANAINQWIFKNIDYISGTTDSGTSAYDTLTQRQGVCKDFAHLGIALCRAINIPARYFTGYAYKLYPPDFHACFEAYIGGNWLIFDPTMLVPINGMVKIANGKDAAEVAVANFFGKTNCIAMKVECNVLDDFQPLDTIAFNQQAIVY